MTRIYTGFLRVFSGNFCKIPEPVFCFPVPQIFDKLNLGKATCDIAAVPSNRALQYTLPAVTNSYFESNRPLCVLRQDT